MAEIIRKFETIATGAAGEYIDVQPLVQLLDPQWYPFTLMLNKYTQGAQEVGTSMKFYWHVQDSYPLSIDITADDGSDTFSVAAEADINGLYVGCVVYSKDAGTDDWRVVTSITRNGASTVFDAVNVLGTDNTGSYVSGNTFMIGGTVQAEGGRAGTVEYGYTEKYNFLQPMAVELEKTDLADFPDRVSDAQFQKERSLVQFEKHMEMALILGERGSHAGVGSVETSDGKLYFTGGLQYWIPTANKFEEVDDNFDMDYWWDITENITKFGSIDKYALTGFGLYKKIRKLYGDNNIQLTPEQTEFGVFDCDTIYNRKLYLVPHPGFTGDLNNKAFIIDPPYLRNKVKQPISVRDIEYGRYDKTGYKYKTIFGLKPLNLETLFSLEIT